MQGSTILEAIRRSYRAVLVRDLVQALQRERQREGENWARKTDPLNLGAFPEGRRMLLRAMGPNKFRPQAAEQEVMHELRWLAKSGAIRLERMGKAFNPAQQAIPFDTTVLINEEHKQ